MSIWVDILSGYCPVGRVFGQASVYRASVRGLPSGKFTARSGYYLSEMCPRRSIRRPSVPLGY